MGKGSKTRPRAVSADEYDRRWESTFGQKKELKMEQEKKLKELDDEERARRESRGW